MKHRLLDNPLPSDSCYFVTASPIIDKPRSGAIIYLGKKVGSQRDRIANLELREVTDEGVKSFVAGVRLISQQSLTKSQVF